MSSIATEEGIAGITAGMYHMPHEQPSDSG